MTQQLFNTERVTLTGGWSAEVLTSAGFEHDSSWFDGPWPTQDAWRPELETLLWAPDSLENYEVLKIGQSSHVVSATFSFGNAKMHIVAKRARAHSLVRKVADMFRASRARRSFQNSCRLLQLKFRTPRPLVILENRRKTESWLITSFVDGLVDLDELALRGLSSLAPSLRHQAKRTLVQAVARFMARFQQAGLLHRDLKASNIMIRDLTGGTPAVWLLDLEGLQLRHPPKEERMLMRLASSLLEYASVTRTDYARFLKSYIADMGQDATSWQTRYRTLAALALQRNRRAVRRKRGKLDGYMQPE